MCISGLGFDWMSSPNSMKVLGFMAWTTCVVYWGCLYWIVVGMYLVECDLWCGSNMVEVWLGGWFCSVMVGWVVYSYGGDYDG